MFPVRVETLEKRVPEEHIDVFLRRYRPSTQTEHAVLLIHGASASSDTFLLPDGGLVYYLRNLGWDVWTLDWRGSREVVDPLSKVPPLGGSIAAECNLFTLDRVVERDFPDALDFIRNMLSKESGAADSRIAVVAHCFGSGAFAMAIARGHIEGKGVRNVVLSTLGLFYETPWHGWVKAEDFLIELVLAETALQETPDCRAIDPRHAPHWPAAMKQAFSAWPRTWLPRGATAWDDVFRRLSFMFGEPYLRDRLAKGIHGPLLGDLFGGMHLGLYVHAGQMVRRGYSARLNDSRRHRSFEAQVAARGRGEPFGRPRSDVFQRQGSHAHRRCPESALASRFHRPHVRLAMRPRPWKKCEKAHLLGLRASGSCFGASARKRTFTRRSAAGLERDLG